jgi:hypothetical protein
MKHNLLLKDTFQPVNALVGKEMAVYSENHMQSKTHCEGENVHV